ncbi:aminotransferase class III-fold pyridoxal phosphate-dependent enzyme [bacterium]|nr:aminotransferase class III-fold pyridoxal phosphate-dependent enzyme [bacterium]
MAHLVPTVENLAELSSLDQAHHLHPFTSIAAHAADGPMVMIEGKGTHVTDHRGRSYLDAFAGLWCMNVGYGREEIADAMAAQAKKLPYYHSFLAMANEPSIRLAERLVQITPKSLSKVFFGLTGSDGNDTLIKIIWYYNNLLGRPKKKKIIARKLAYHGVTVASGSLSGLPNLHGGFDLPVDRFLHVTTPHYYRQAPAGMTEREFSAHLAQELESVILREGPDTIAAFFAEPVMGAGGVYVPPEGYFEAIVPILRRYDILFAADEVICGFGRLGRWFGSDYFHLEPDLMTGAKGLTSGYAPLSMSLISQPIWKVLHEGSPTMGPFGHGFTYSAHPVSAAAAMANLDIIEREKLVDRVARLAPILQTKLRETLADHPLVGEVRGVGFVAAMELVADKKAKAPFDLKLGVAMRAYKKVLARGVIVRPIMNNLAVSPPFVITEQEIDEVVSALKESIDETARELAAEGIWKPS